MKKHGMFARSFRSMRVRLGLSLCLLLAAGFAHADDPAVVRLSFLNGGVQASAGQGTAANNAVVNMPLFDGSVVSTGTDGQAEVEFADGSVARLTPNSSLELTHLQRMGPSGHTDLTLLGGLAYFELNVGQGQSFLVKMGPANLRPVENAIFRLSLDTMPNATVLQGTIHIEGVHSENGTENSGLDTEVTANQDVRFDPADPSQYTLNEGTVADSWDQWNTDRDASIAQMSANQTAVRDDSQVPSDPGWNDLDYYGNWYPVDGYGDVWTPSDVGSDWDPFGYGYWGNYSGYGTTWISGYPWGWLPYHCGAWNYFQFGWGWVPGGCGLGWSPVVPVWNTPPGYRLPGWPKAPGLIPSQHRPPLGGSLIPVDRGPGARGPWDRKGGVDLLHARGLQNTAVTAPSLQVEGKAIRPLPRVPSPVSSPVLAQSGGQLSDRVVVNSGPHVGVPTSTNAYRLGSPAVYRSSQPLGYGGPRSNVQRSVGAGGSIGQPRPVGRSTYTPPPARPAPPAPAPHVAAPPPVVAPVHH